MSKSKYVTEYECKRAMGVCQEILSHVQITFNIEDIQSKSREKDLNFRRALIVFILIRKKYSKARIGAFLNRDHATIINLQKYSKKKHGRDSRYKEITRQLELWLIDEDVNKMIEFHTNMLAKLQGLLQANKTLTS